MGRQWSYAAERENKLKVECYALKPYDCFTNEFLENWGTSDTFIVKFYSALLTIAEIPMLGYVIYIFIWSFELILGIGSPPKAPGGFLPVPEINLEWFVP